MRAGSAEQVPAGHESLPAVVDAEPELVRVAVAEPELAAQTAC
jgi:hypothetical protein